MAIDLFSIGRFTVHGYGLMIGLGFLAAVFVGNYLAKKSGLSDNDFVNMAMFVLIIGFLGGKLLHVIVEFKAFLSDPFGKGLPHGLHLLQHGQAGLPPQHDHGRDPGAGAGGALLPERHPPRASHRAQPGSTDRTSFISRAIISTSLTLGFGMLITTTPVVYGQAKASST